MFYVTCSEMKPSQCAACEEYGYEAIHVEEKYSMYTGLLLSVSDM